MGDDISKTVAELKGNGAAILAVDPRPDAKTIRWGVVFIGAQKDVLIFCGTRV
jgi:hypothetical protein